MFSSIPGSSPHPTKALSVVLAVTLLGACARPTEPAKARPPSPSPSAAVVPSDPCAAVQGSQSMPRVVSVRPDRLRGGEEAVVEAIGFSAGTDIEVRVGRPGTDLVSGPLGTFRSNEEGRVEARFIVPAGTMEAAVQVPSGARCIGIALRAGPQSPAAYLAVAVSP